MQLYRTTLPRNFSRNIKRATLKPTTIIHTTHKPQTRNMAFFPRNFCTPEATSFTPLFRLLDDFDSYSRSGALSSQHQQNGRRPGMPTWQPKFDVRETGDDYELHGELPGVEREQVQIEFTDPQTILVRGRVERSYSGTGPRNAAGHIEDGEAADDASTKEKQAHRATVEDADEGAARPSAPASETSDAVVTQERKRPADNAKYWVTERSIGEFSRSFNFPTRVNQDAVSASFKNGILSITVPKAKKHETRRIAIN